MKEYFRILGLSENASYEEIKSARIKLLKKYHPDLYAGNKKLAELKSAEINQAFAFLSNYFQNNKSTLKVSEFKEPEDNKIINDIKKEKVFKEKTVNNIETKKNKNIESDETENNKDKKGKKLLDILIYILIIIFVCLLVVLVAT